MVIKKYFKKIITTLLIGITVLIPINDLSYAQSKNLIFNNINIEQGISRIDIVNNLGVTDGLQVKEFNGNSAFKSKSGELFFGVINGLKLNNNADNIKINFFTPIYSSKKNISYEYELIGVSSSKSTTKENYVTYNDLLPGKYTFKAKSVDSRGYISDSETIDFSIKYPFWMSPIACFIYLAIAILLIINNKNKLKKLDRLVTIRTKELEEEMIKNEELYKSNIKNEENKNKYLVDLSHELRTPLNAISSTNQLLLGLSKNDTIKPDKLSYYIDISERNCNRLLNLVNNILDHTKLQNRMYTLNLKEVDIIYLVEETSLTLIDYIKFKSIEFIIDPEVEEKVIICDDYEIERCIVNLVSNAAKFTPEGGTITITIKDLDDKVMISVLDTGIGIEEKYHKTIFDRFNQVDNDESKGGSGLGLSITSKIVELHNGEIYVESKVGEGSNFVIILPVDPNKK